MKLSKKTIKKAHEKEMRRRDGHSVNNLEQEQALEELKKKLSKPDTLAVLQRMKDR
jgi:hypothetical protein